MEFLPITIDYKRVYAGFGKRFCAGWVDFFVILPFSLLFIWLWGLDKNLAILITIPSSALFAMYHVYFNARYGGTLGKLALGIRISRPNGSKIGWTEAWKRSSVDLVFAFITMIAEIWALTQVVGADYSAAPLMKRIELVQSNYPVWLSTVNMLSTVWVWSEVVVLLFNERRRAIHDFIAGTVVIHKQFVTQDK